MSATVEIKFMEKTDEPGNVKIEVFTSKFEPSQAELTIARAFHSSVVDCIDDVVKRTNEQKSTTQDTEVKEDAPTIITPDSY